MIRRTTIARRCGGPQRGFLYGLMAIITAAILVVTGCDESRKNNGVTEHEANANRSQTIMAYGTVTAGESREIRLPFDARISDIPVWVGSRVERGESLVVLDPRDIPRAEEEARLDWEVSDTLLRENVSRLAALDVQVEEARAQTERLVRLNSGGSVSVQDLESKKAELAALGHDRAAEAWAVESRRREAEAKKLLYEEFREKLDAPFIFENSVVCPAEAAVVAEIPIRRGAEVEAGTLILVLDDVSSLLVEADLPEEFVRDVEPGVEATVIPVADPDRRYAGRVSALAGRAVLLNGETVVKTRVVLDDADDGFLRAGFNVDVEILPPGGEDDPAPPKTSE